MEDGWRAPAGLFFFSRRVLFAAAPPPGGRGEASLVGVESGTAVCAVFRKVSCLQLSLAGYPHAGALRKLTEPSLSLVSTFWVSEWQLLHSRFLLETCSHTFPVRAACGGGADFILPAVRGVRSPHSRMARIPGRTRRKPVERRTYGWGVQTIRTKLAEDGSDTRI